MTGHDSTTLLLVNNLTLAFSFLALAIAISWIAYLKKYFSLPSINFLGPRLRFIQVLGNFLIFITIYICLAPLVYKILSSISSIANNRAILISSLQLSVFLLTAAFFYLFALFQDPKILKRILKDRSFPQARSFLSDIKIAVLTLLISLPLVIAIGHFSEIITTMVFGPSLQEQIAIRYLKLAASSNIGLTITLTSILIGAPFIEEYLFRGILQTYLRNKIGAIKAIITTAFCFAVFHFSPQQSTTNIPLIITLFTLSLYLGFLYEKTRSLTAPIFLHVTFNSLSVIRIILIMN